MIWAFNFYISLFAESNSSWSMPNELVIKILLCFRVYKKPFVDKCLLPGVISIKKCKKEIRIEINVLVSYYVIYIRAS